MALKNLALPRTRGADPQLVPGGRREADLSKFGQGFWTGAPCSPWRTWAEKDGAHPFNALWFARKRCWCERAQSSME